MRQDKSRSRQGTQHSKPMSCPRLALAYDILSPWELRGFQLAYWAQRRGAWGTGPEERLLTGRAFPALIH